MRCVLPKRHESPSGLQAFGLPVDSSLKFPDCERGCSGLHLRHKRSTGANRMKHVRRGPRIALLLGLVLLIPVTSLAAVTGATAVSSWNDRRTAGSVRTDVAESSAIMTARSLIVAEGLPSIALANAAES